MKWRHEDIISTEKSLECLSLFLLFTWSHNLFLIYRSHGKTVLNTGLQISGIPFYSTWLKHCGFFLCPTDRVNLSAPTAYFAIESALNETSCCSPLELLAEASDAQWETQWPGHACDNQGGEAWTKAQTQSGSRLLTIYFKVAVSRRSKGEAQGLKTGEERRPVDGGWDLRQEKVQRGRMQCRSAQSRWVSLDETLLQLIPEVTRGTA